MATLYKGYAQARGFGANVVNVPDPSEKIRKQGLIAMGHMKDQIEWNRRQANRLTATLEKNQQIEAENRERNFQAGQFYNRKLAEGKWKNFETAVNDAKTREGQAKSDFKALLSLTESGTKLYAAWDAKRKGDIDNFAQEIYDQHGIGLEKLNGVQAIEDHIWNKDSTREAALAKMGLDGVPPDVIRRIRSTGGYTSLAVGKLNARRWSLARGSLYASKWNQKYEIPGVGEVDLAQAAGANVDTVLSLIDREARAELGDNAPSSKMMALSGSYELLERARAQIRQRKSKAAINEAVKQQHQDEKTVLADLIGTDSTGTVVGPAGFQRAIYYYAGGENAPREQLVAAKTRVVSAIIDGLEQGDWTWDEVRGLENLEVKVRGVKGKVKWGEHFKKDWLQIELAGINAAKLEGAKAQLAYAGHQAKGNDFYAEVLELNLNENPDIETLTKLHSIAVKNNWPKAASYLEKQIQQGGDRANDEAGLARLQDRINRSEYIDVDELDNLHLSSGAKAKAKALIAKNNPFLPTQGDTGTGSRLEYRIKQKLQEVIPSKNTVAHGSTRNDAEIAAIERARTYYKAAMTKGASHEEAYEEARDRIIRAIDDPNGLWAPKVNQKTGTREFGGFTVRQVDEPLDVDVDKIIEELTQNPDAIYENAYIDREDLAAKSAALNKGLARDLLPRSVLIHSTMRGQVQAIDAEMAQIAYYNKLAAANGTQLIPEYPKWYVDKVKGFYQKVSPRTQRLLHTYNYCDVNKAACSNDMNPIYTKPSEDKAREVMGNSLNTKEDYNHTDLGNAKEAFGFHLVNRPISDIIRLFEETDTITTAGRYAFTSETLKEAAQLAGISLNDKFTADTQDKLFNAYFKKNGATMIQTVPDEQQRLLLESIYKSLTEEKLSSNFGMHAPHLLNKEAYNILYAGGRYA